MSDLLLVGVAAFFIGWLARDIRDNLVKLSNNRVNIVGSPAAGTAEDKPSVSFADSLNPAERAIKENQDRIANLNK